MVNLRYISAFCYGDCIQFYGEYSLLCNERTFQNRSAGLQDVAAKGLDNYCGCDVIKLLWYIGG